MSRLNIIQSIKTRKLTMGIFFGVVIGFAVLLIFLVPAVLNSQTSTAAPTNPAPPNLLSNQLATLMAQNAQNPQSNTNSGQSSQPIDLDQISLIAGLMASIVTVVGGVYAGYRVLRGKK